jgi:hypothetical protein
MVVAIALAFGCAACSSSTRNVSAPSTAGPATSAPPTTTPGGTPTVFDCGGGAYEPATLVVVCGTGTTIVTGVAWSSWTASEAAGTGTVHLGSSSAPGRPAKLTLSDAVATPQGPQFSVLTATWTGPSPDGKPSETFRLAVAGSS